MIEQCAPDLYLLLTIGSILLLLDLIYYLSLLLSDQLRVLDLSTYLHLLLNQVLCMHKALNKLCILLLLLILHLVLLSYLHLLEVSFLELYFMLFFHQFLPQILLFKIES